jgi:subtilisin family serine protease
VWVAAPGEGIVSTYPYGTYAAGWGTSFSAPFVSGTAALLINVSAGVNQQTAAAAIANAQPISSTGMGNGRLDTYMAVQSWVTTTGQQ